MVLNLVVGGPSRHNQPSRPQAVDGHKAGMLCKVETEGDTITCCAISSSGEVMAFGGNGGYAHIWAGRRDAHVNAMSQPLPPPAPRAPPRATLAEHDSFSRAPQYPLLEVCPCASKLFVSCTGFHHVELDATISCMCLQSTGGVTWQMTSDGFDC